MKKIVELLAKDLNDPLLTCFKENKIVSVSGAGNYSSKIFIVLDVLKNFPELTKIVWIVNDFTELENIVKHLSVFDSISVYPFIIQEEDYDTVKQKESAEQKKIIELISHLSSDQKEIIVFKYKDLFRSAPSKKAVQENIITVSSSENKKIMDLFENLIENGYEVSEDSRLIKGTYLRHGGNLDIFPINRDSPIRIEADFDLLGQVMEFKQENAKDFVVLHRAKILPLNLENEGSLLLEHVYPQSLVIDDELEIIEDVFPEWQSILQKTPESCHQLAFTPFYEDTSSHVNLHYLSVIGYPTVFDLISDIQEKKFLGWKVVVFTKNFEELSAVFADKKVPYTSSFNEYKETGDIFLYKLDNDELMPAAFQSTKYKFIFVTDREIEALKEKHKKAVGASHKVYLDFLTSLKIDDYVVHSDHGIALFQGLEKKTVDDLTREYLKLGYAENDKLFVPIDQADRVSKFIGTGDGAPKLTRLGSTEWTTMTNRVRKETEKIAKELLLLYAGRELAHGYSFKSDSTLQEQFEKTFPYEETSGQIKAIVDVKKDMETPKPMDRLICGDVGFGKTEVAMRASFKAVQNRKQVAFISPITILADQHYRSFTSRMDPFDVRVDMLSRFKTKGEQKIILERLRRGDIDIIIGTHRLLQEDVAFKDLGLVIIDEEQRFGVKQKEKFKELRKEVDVLTMTATPIPRTLNLSLNRLRDISTITTPPRGRLPVIVEVRRYSDELIREVILNELERKGQVYFLHNRVQTIEGVAQNLRGLIPSASFVVAHGKLASNDLERRIIDFKDQKYDVLVSSTIIENGIDLPNANTLIVNNAERFGLAQLYQLRGRVGRGDKQAYSYFLYRTQRLPYDAKKRLRSIVEACELGSGFQIAMKDLEIRGAGDILGANQHGAINVVGVSHYIRMLNQVVEDLKAGKRSETEKPIDVSIELPITAFIPDFYIPNAKDKITVYQKLASADSFEYLHELEEELAEDYGALPKEVAHLFRVLEIKLFSKKAGLLNVKAENIHDTDMRQIILHMSEKVKPENIFNLLEYNSKWIISGTKLKIKTKDLGVNWITELKECLERLGSKKITNY